MCRFYPCWQGCTNAIGMGLLYGTKQELTLAFTTHPAKARFHFAQLAGLAGFAAFGLGRHFLLGIAALEETFKITVRAAPARFLHQHPVAVKI